MNNKPKFKKGDIVRVFGDLVTIAEVDETYAVLLLDDGTREYCPLSELEPYTQTPDMLAIPDDHVFTETNNQQ